MSRPKTSVLISLALSPSSPQVSKAAAFPSLPHKVTFNEHVRPILSNNYFPRHGFDFSKRKEKLRLDTVEGASAALNSDKSQHAIVPGDTKKNAVWQCITATDPDDILPPPDFHNDLTETIKQLINRRIAQGAVNQQHWPFAPIEKPAVTEMGAKNPIDAFVRKNLETHGLKCLIQFHCNRISSLQ